MFDVCSASIFFVITSSYIRKLSKIDPQRVLLPRRTLRTPLYSHVKSSSRRSKKACYLVLFSRNLLCYNVSKRLYNHLSSSSRRGKNPSFLRFLRRYLLRFTVLEPLIPLALMGNLSELDAQQVFPLRNIVRITLYSPIRSSNSERSKGSCFPVIQGRIYHVTLYVNLCTTSIFGRNPSKPDVQ